MYLPMFYHRAGYLSWWALLRATFASELVLAELVMEEPRGRLESLCLVGLVGRSQFRCSYAAISREFLGDGEGSALLISFKLMVFFSGEFLWECIPILPPGVELSAVALPKLLCETLVGI
jgi:hypothetical protein